MAAISETGNTLLAAFDPADSVGVIDKYFPTAAFFTEFERFDRFIDKQRRNLAGPDFISVCSPNYLHDAHTRFGLRSGADVICEKPLVLNPWNLEALIEYEAASGKKVFPILQLRHHAVVPTIREMMKNAQSRPSIDLTYITSRGLWYYASWKGDIAKSGGIATNIGIHFFDMLLLLFGKVEDNIVHLHTHDRAAGLLKLEHADVRWFLSINSETLPAEVKAKNKTTYRSLRYNGQEIEFTDGFTDLHTTSYREILDGNGFSLEDCLPSIALVHDIRTRQQTGPVGDYHPLAALPMSKHPFI